MAVNIQIPDLGDKYKDYRDEIPGDSYNWGPVINASQIASLTIHHSVTTQTAKNDGNWKAECNKIANLHLAKGWGGVGYRFIVASDGTVAYVGDLSHGGSGVENQNNVTFSICLVGDFTKELPTAYQINSTHKLCKFFLFDTPQYPNVNDWGDIKGHKEWKATACPGTNWKVAGDNLYDRIKNDNWQGYPNPKPIVAPQPSPSLSPSPSMSISPSISPSTSPSPSQAPDDPYVTLQKVEDILFGVNGVQDKLDELRVLLP